MALGVDARSARVGSAAAITEALEANRVLVAELQSLEQSLTQEEAKLLAKTQSIRRGMALRRAQQAMDSLLPPEPERKVVDPFTKGPRSRKKLSEVAVRSYIRQQVSFFTDEEQCEPKRGRPKKKQKKTVEASNDEDIEKAVLGAMSEPPPNADTEFLRSHSHESFVAGPPTIFTARERKVLKDFAEDFYMTHSHVEEIPLEEWNEIQNWQDMRKSRQLPIERSGFACKLWYDLHDSPKVRLGAWTKQEDAALRRLAKGEVDPSVVNQWHEIAKRMPIPGRPAAHCLTRYQTTLCAGNTKSAFTPEEDEILREAVPVFGEKWNVIADLLDGRVSEQIRHRWQLSLAPGIRRGKFSVIEDRRMILALRAYASNDGEFNHDRVAWNEICHHIPGRTQPAIRDRYFNCLNPELSFRKFTKQEDQIILARVRQWGIESARLWPRLAAELGDRSDSQVCRRWRLLDPEGYEKRRQVLEEASKKQTTAVFRRRSIHRHQPQYSKKHTTRSSYNGNAVESTPMQLSGPILRIHSNGTATLHGTELLQVREGENGSTQFIL